MITFVRTMTPWSIIPVIAAFSVLFNSFIKIWMIRYYAHLIDVGKIVVNHLLERATDRPSGEGIYRSITDPCLVLRFRTRSLIHVGFPPCHPVECKQSYFQFELRP